MLQKGKEPPCPSPTKGCHFLEKETKAGKNEQCCLGCKSVLFVGEGKPFKKGGRGSREHPCDRVETRVQWPLSKGQAPAQSCS